MVGKVWGLEMHYVRAMIVVEACVSVSNDNITTAELPHTGWKKSVGDLKNEVINRLILQMN